MSLFLSLDFPKKKKSKMEDLDFAHYKVFQMEQFFLSQVTLLQTKHSTSRKNPVDTNSILILGFKM